MTISEAMAVGAAVLAVGSMIERLRALQASNKGQGQRIGALEREVERLNERERVKQALGICEYIPDHRTSGRQRLPPVEEPPSRQEPPPVQGGSSRPNR